MERLGVCFDKQKEYQKESDTAQQSQDVLWEAIIPFVQSNIAALIK